MKKLIVLFLTVFTCAFLNFSFATNDSHSTVTAGKSLCVSTLIVDADVTVVLVNNGKTVPEMVGNKSFSKHVALRISGDTLVISAPKSKSLQHAGVVYIPATHLRKIQINSEAHVKSLSYLRIAKLDVVVNGNCTFEVSNIGHVNLIETKGYFVESSRQVRQYPASAFRE